MTRAQRVSDHVLARRGSDDFGSISEAADDGHAGEVGAGRGGEGACEEERGEACGGAEGGEEGHVCLLVVDCGLLVGGRVELVDMGLICGG